MYGPLSGYPQTTPRAELEAIASTLENALPPILIVTDHLNHVEAFYKGKYHCLKVTSPLIDIWIRIWKQLHRLGRGNVTLKWIPSHQAANKTTNQHPSNTATTKQRRRRETVVAGYLRSPGTGAG